MNHHRPHHGAATTIQRVCYPLVVLVLVGLQLSAEDQVPPPVVIPFPAEDQFPPVVVPPPVDVPPAVDGPIIEEPVIIHEGLFVGNGIGFVDVDLEERALQPPEIAAPHAPAKPSALILRWHQYRTLVVIDTSIGLVKPCWIVTLSTMPERIETDKGPITIARGQTVVAYRGQAYYDKNGILQIDARGARLSGILADSWSPDSFAITPTGQVTARDDNPSHESNAGEIEKEVSAESQREEYRRLMFTAQSLVEENL